MPSLWHWLLILSALPVYYGLLRPLHRAHGPRYGERRRKR